MKTRFAFTISLVSILFISQTVFAHSPADINIAYDHDNKTITAIIAHPVPNPRQHYVHRVEVSVNGKEIIRHNISMQENSNSQTVSYRIADLKPGDVIDIEAYCNINGKRGKAIEIR